MSVLPDDPKNPGAKKQHHLVSVKNIKTHDSQSDENHEGVLHHGLAQAVNCREDHRDHCRANTEDEGTDLRHRPVRHVKMCKEKCDGHGWKYEACPCNNKPSPPRSDIANVNCHLGGVGPGNEVRRPEQIEKLLVGDPTSPLNNLVFHHCDVSGRTSECDCSKFQEQ